METDLLILPKKRLNEWVKTLMQEYKVYAPMKNIREHKFDLLEDCNDLTLHYTRTVIPPKSILHPPCETILKYSMDIEKDMDEEIPSIDNPIVLLGVHPCDARGIYIYDVVFGGMYADPYYWNIRNNSYLVAVTCQDPDESCFCTSMSELGPTLQRGMCDLVATGGGEENDDIMQLSSFDEGLFDLLLTDLGDKFLVEVGSFKGEDLVKYDFFETAEYEHMFAKEDIVGEVREKINNKLPSASNIPQILPQYFNDLLWKKESEKCVACGSCTLVCPTCFCYNVDDVTRFNLKEGERVRIWDSCQLLEYASVAEGENFRKDKTARLKNRIYHKLANWPQQFNTLGCIGCGRCIHYCIANIDMTEIISQFKGEKAYA